MQGNMYLSVCLLKVTVLNLFFIYFFFLMLESKQDKIVVA